MQAAPASFNALAAFKSGYIYGITTNPSNLTKLPHPISLARRAILTASFAFLAPDVLGNKVTLSGM